MSTQLSTGACARLNIAGPEDEELLNNRWTLQVLSVKKVSAQSPTSTAPDRNRIIISDGVNFLQAMLATQLNPKVESGEVGKNTVIVVTKLSAQVVFEKRLLIVLDLETVANDVPKIGQPLAFVNDPPGVPAAAPVSAPAAPSKVKPPAASSSAQGSRPPARFNANVFPIEGLSPYQNNYTIKARVIQKSDIKTWANAKGEGKLFNCTFADESGEIRATAFNTAVDTLFDKIEEGKVYWVSKARIQLAKKKFSNVQNDYEMSLDGHTEIEQCHDTVNMPEVKFDFKGLDQLTDVPADSHCDVIGVVKEVGPVSALLSKASNKEIMKRDLTIVDTSATSIRVTLWGKQATSYQDDGNYPVIAFKGVKVGDFGGRSLSVLSSSTMMIDPDIPQSHELRGWYDAIGVDSTFKAQSSTGMGGGTQGAFNRNEVKSFAQVKEENLGSTDQADYFSQRATIMHVRPESMMYPACNSEGCNKKVIERDTGDWWCEKDQKAWPRPQYRYIISMAVADATSQLWISAFNDIGEMIFGMNATELHDLGEHDVAAYNAVIAKSNSLTFNFSCKAKTESYQDISRVKFGVVKAARLDYKVECAEMLKLLKSPWAC